MTDGTAPVSQAWNWSAIPRVPLREGIVRQMLHGERIMVCRLTIAPGIAVPAHRHPHEQITIVERGRVRYLLGAEERIFGPADVILLPGNFWHGAAMLDEEVVLVDIFSPVRKDLLEAER
jgi:quercetin dioxygenase-like cupin family protein